MLGHKTSRNGQGAHVNVFKHHLSSGRCQVRSQQDTGTHRVRGLVLESPKTTSVDKEVEHLQLSPIAGASAKWHDFLTCFGYAFYS